MSLISPHTISSHKLNHLLQIQRKAEFLPPLFVGEIIEAEVVKNIGDRNMLIMLKNAWILADSGLSLEEGKKITVRVAQLHPRVILRIARNEKSGNSRIMDCLRFYRSNPNALFEFFMSSQEKLDEIASYLGKENVENIQRMIKSLIISKGNIENNLFFKDYIFNFGYLTENKLRNAVDRRFCKTANVKDVSQNLKGLLVKLFDKLQLLTESRNPPAAEKLAEFVNLFLKAIESHQVINYLFQEHDGKYMFQIPMLFPEDMGIAKVFVKFEDMDSEGKGCQKQKSVLFLLSMDALGDIVVETKIVRKNIGSVLKCKDKNVRDFILPFLKELGGKLMTLGYNIDYLKCVVDPDVLEARDECREFQSLYTQEGVNLYG